LLIVNNISTSNLEAKAKDFNEVLHGQYFPWFAQYMVMQTIITIYSSLGEGALCHSLNETEATTVVCGPKELKKLIDISGQLDTVKRVIYISESGVSAEVSLAKNNSS